MKTKNLIVLFLIAFLLSITGLEAQNYKTQFTNLFKTMHKEQLKVAKSNNFTKSEVAAIDKAMATAGTNLNKALKAAPGEPHQYLIDNINKEFRTLNTQLGRTLSGKKLTAFQGVTNNQKNVILRAMKSNFVGSSGANRDNIRAGLRVGIRVSLMRGFGGDDPGWRP